MIAQMELSELLQGGAAGIVVLVVVLFLRHLTEQRKGYEEFQAKRDDLWMLKLDQSTNQCYESHERTQVMVVDSIKGLQEQNTREHDAMIRSLERLQP